MSLKPYKISGTNFSYNLYRVRRFYQFLLIELHAKSNVSKAVPESLARENFLAVTRHPFLNTRFDMGVLKEDVNFTLPPYITPLILIISPFSSPSTFPLRPPLFLVP
jgi:hypothetical protein